jgi:hypothetical protein
MACQLLIHAVRHIFFRRMLYRSMQKRSVERLPDAVVSKERWLVDKAYEILDVLGLEDLVYTHVFFEILSDSIDEFHQGDRISSDGVEIIV